MARGEANQLSGRRPPLLLYLNRAADIQRFAVGPALAAACERAGWGFECYYDSLRRGRHFGGGPVDAAVPGESGGSLVAGGAHAEQLLWLATQHEIVAAGDPSALLWPTVEAAGIDVLVRASDPVEVLAAALERLGQPVPESVLVLDGAPQGAERVVTAPYLYPAVLAEEVVAVDVSSGPAVRAGLERLGARRIKGLGIDEARAGSFPGGLDESEPVEAGSYAELTVAMARRHAGWGRGVLVGDPDLVAAQLPKARRLRLLPLYGTPQLDAIEGAADLIRGAAEPVFGRQYDDSDFIDLARLGHGLQVVDPGPPFDAAWRHPPAIADPPRALADEEPDDAQLEQWADEGRVLVSLLLWSGMLREIDCLPRLIDLAITTGLKAGLLVTAETVEHAARPPLSLLTTPVEQGGAFGLLEPLLACTGRGVAAEAYMPPGTLAPLLAEAVQATAERLPRGIRPRGWWPLLDTPLEPRRPGRLTVRKGRPVLRVKPRPWSELPHGEAGSEPGSGGRDLRSRMAGGVRRLGLRSLVDYERPFEDRAPGEIDRGVAGAVRSCGFEYMFTKAGFGTPRPVLRDGEFVALPSTAGRWDGWSPFWTLSWDGDLKLAERRLTRHGRPGWLVSTIDGPLWALPGEVWEHGSGLYKIARLAAEGGATGRLVNVTPNVVARYARLIDGRG